MDADKILWGIQIFCLICWVGLIVDRYFLQKKRIIEWLIEKTRREKKCVVCQRPMIIVKEGTDGAT